jgi:hypothetical protein|tara:strand:+ start:324 stop:554 length:231 start_codon:yes stop_codon:yes gene_type:complete
MAENRTETELSKLGGVFRNTSKAGTVYYSGTLENKDGNKFTVVLYRNDYWEEGAQKPYFNVYEKVPKGQAKPKVMD